MVVQDRCSVRSVGGEGREIVWGSKLSRIVTRGRGARRSKLGLSGREDSDRRFERAQLPSALHHHRFW